MRAPQPGRLDEAEPLLRAALATWEAAYDADHPETAVARLLPDGEPMPIYDAAMRYQQEGEPLVVFGGKEYGTVVRFPWLRFPAILRAARWGGNMP